MESLQPVIKHRFWVCLGFSFILTLLGWWLGTSSLAKEAEANRKKIESSENALPKGDQLENDDWIKNIKAVNKERFNHYRKQSVKLWDMQKSRRTWPTDVAPLMANAEHFGPGSNESARDLFRASYHDQTIENLHKIVDPYKHYKDGDTYSSSGLVLFDKNLIPQVDKQLWNLQPPSWAEIWRAQEDAWLCRAILESVARVNKLKNATSIHDACIRQIVQLQLRGGSKVDGESSEGSGQEGGSTPDYSESGGTGGTVGNSGITGNNDDPFGLGTGSGTGTATSMGTTGTVGDGAISRSSGGGPPGMGGGASGQGGNGLLPVNLDLVLGPQVAKASAEGDDSNPEGGTESGSTPDYSANGVPGGGNGGAGQQQANMSPYVDNDPEMPFKTRGFLIKVLMKRKDVPLFIQELTDAEKSGFPIEIRLIHQLDKNRDFTGQEEQQRYASRGGATNGGTIGPQAFPGTTPMGSGLVPGSGPMEGGNGFPMGVGPSTTPGPLGLPSSGGPGMTGGANRAPYESALNDDGLGYVVIAGVMTIYQPPKKLEVDENEQNPNDTNQATNNNNNNVSNPNTPNVPSKSAPKTPAEKSGVKNNPKTDPKPLAGKGTQPTVPSPKKTGASAVPAGKGGKKIPAG